MIIVPERIDRFLINPLQKVKGDSIENSAWFAVYFVICEVIMSSNDFVTVGKICFDGVFVRTNL